MGEGCEVTIMAMAGSNVVWHRCGIVGPLGMLDFASDNLGDNLLLKPCSRFISV
jgi:hypothetical protein